ncbi:DgyrCDS13543 [Dimorphilus gyrociliatus]|uniref:DgyrCDS13543 n=1 Tax=Dimorphilus gyrociliatus TaxID=2664684 RepID=A0A7I8WB16_9ANNE|nr:DgyrCDS13543 [Dimorphilus gyrociliatus]
MKANKLLFILIVFVACFLSSANRQFPGDCNAGNICEQECNDVGDNFYECQCFDNYELIENGIDCKVSTPINRVEPTTESISDDEYDFGVLDPYQFSSKPSNSLSKRSHKFSSSDFLTKKMRDSKRKYNRRKNRKGRKKKSKKKKGKKGKKKSSRRRKTLKEKPIADQDSKLIPTEDISKIYKKCIEIECSLHGECIEDEMVNGVKCACKFGYWGRRCEEKIDISYPRFFGSGYLTFSKLYLRNSYKDFTFEIEFKPETNNGLLLYSAEFPDGKYDFFSVALIGGYVEYRFDCGSGTVKIRSNEEVRINEWNTLVVSKYYRTGSLYLNGGNATFGESARLAQIVFKQDLYLGGFKNLSAVGSRTGMKFGFIGCVRKLKLNHRVFQVRSPPQFGDVLNGVDIGSCTSHLCKSINCEQGGKCKVISSDRAICLCPYGRVGDRCEIKKTSTVPEFTGYSYLQFFGLGKDIYRETDIEVVFKPSKRNGLILYNGYSSSGGDFISLALLKGYLEFRFDLGTGPAVIRSRSPVEMDQWHRVKLHRRLKLGSMELDNDLRTIGYSKGDYSMLTLQLDLFIGGHRDFYEVSPLAGVDVSFVGCIQKVVINGKPLKLTEKLLYGINIHECEHICNERPCRNGGICVPNMNNYQCSCLLGFGNAHCEDIRTRRDIGGKEDAISFRGNSWLSLNDDRVHSLLTDSVSEIEFSFKTNFSDGLIFWVGQNLSFQPDFLAIGVRGGHVEFSFNLGHGDAIITDKTFKVSDEKWHKVRAIRQDKRGLLEVDGGKTIEKTVPNEYVRLNVDGSGMEDITEKTKGKYTIGLNGCLKFLKISDDDTLDMLGKAKDGRNIKKCEKDDIHHYT